MKRNTLFLAILLTLAVSGVQGQDIEKTGQALRLELARSLVRFNPYNSVSTTKSEILMMEADINNAGKIVGFRLLSNYMDSTLQKSLEHSLDKAKESITISNAIPGTYPILLCLLYGDEDGHIFNTNSIMGAVRAIQEKYRSYKQDPLVITINRYPTSRKN